LALIEEMAQAIDVTDTDTFPLRYPNPNCQHQFKEQVGHLKAGKKVWCPECRAALNYEVRDFFCRHSADSGVASMTTPRHTF
jgi:hypothetical protein